MASAQVPRATAVETALVDVRILETDGGFIVEWESRKPDQSNDSWHATLEEAQLQGTGSIRNRGF